MPNESKEEREEDSPSETTERGLNAEGILRLIEDAWRKTHVASWIPKPLRRLFREQGRYNQIVLDAVGTLARRQTEIATDFAGTSVALQRSEEKVAAAKEEIQSLRMEIARLQEDRTELAAAIERLKDWQISEGASMRAQLTRSAAFSSATAARSLPAGAEPNAEGRARLDAFYVSFEDRFRGSREDIKKRLEFYLPFLAEAGLRTLERPVLDLGCGRGEWLQLLQEHGFVASGADLNEAMVAQCEARGLCVAHADALQHLRSLPDGSLGAVTGFHIIEHLPFDTLMDMFAETWRVLAAAGLAIFESPNCKNLVVGSSQFYIDPTHRNPVFPETAEFMLSLTGFDQTEIFYRAPAFGSPFSEDNPETAYLNDRFFGAQDFAVLARKPSPR